MDEMIGLIAAFLTTLSFLPQAVLVLRTGRTEGISLVMYSMFTLGVAAWLAYGVMMQSLPIMLANLVTLVLAAIILAIKVQATWRDYTATQGATVATSAPIAS